jgi:hypothetical protein
MIQVTITGTSYGSIFVTPLDVFITTRTSVNPEIGLIVSSSQSLDKDKADNKSIDYIGLVRNTFIDKDPGAIDIKTMSATGENAFKDFIVSLKLNNVSAVVIL